MHKRRKLRSHYSGNVRRPKMKSNAYKVANKRTKRLAVATLVFAVVGGSTTALWVVHKVNQFRVTVTTAAPRIKHDSPGSSSNANSPGTSTRQATNSTSTQSTNQPATNAATSPSGSTQKTDAETLPSRSQILQSMMKLPLPTQALINVPAMSQYPQLKNGCEVTSLSMLLTSVHHPVDKMTLAAEEPKDPTPLVLNKQRTKAISWGNPNVGFVGSVSGQKKWGYGIYHGPLTTLVNDILPNQGLDLTGSSFQQIEAVVAGGTPVEVWDTDTFQPTNQWMSWKSPEGTVRATWHEHVVLLVGYNQNYVFINNPLNGQAAQKVPIKPFIQAWEQLGKQAITVAPKPFQQ